MPLKWYHSMECPFNNRLWCKDKQWALQICINRIPSKTKQIKVLIRSHLIQTRMQIYTLNLKLTKNIKQKDADTLILTKRVLLVQDVTLLMVMQNLEIQMIPSNRICSISLLKVKIRIKVKCLLKMIVAVLEEEATLEEISKTIHNLDSTLTISSIQEILNKKMNLEEILIRKIISNNLIKTHPIPNSKQWDADISTCMVLATMGINVHMLMETKISETETRWTCLLNHSSHSMINSKTQQSTNTSNLKCQSLKINLFLNSIKKL